MRLIKNSVYHLFIVLFLFSCDTNDIGSKTEIHYNNIVIFSDLSTRLLREPNDSIIIEQLLNYFVNECVKPGIKINDRSSITFKRMNGYNSQCQNANIDIEQIEPLERKQEFVNSSQLDSAIQNFRQVVRCNYNERDNGGLDLISLIFNDIENGTSLKFNRNIISQFDTTVITFENHFIIFTDGYLEYDRRGANTEFYVGQNEINAIRNYCISNNMSPEEAIQINPEFRLRPLHSQNNKYVNLYVLETDDRGFIPHRGIQLYTGALSDNYILRCIWKDWAENSGIQKFVWKKMTPRKGTPNDFISRLLKSNEYN